MPSANGFVGRQLGLAFGVNLSIARAGSYSAYMSTTWFAPLYERGWQPPLWLAAAITGLTVAACVAYYVLEPPRPIDSASSRRGPHRVVWSDLWRFDRSYWYIVGLCIKGTVVRPGVRISRSSEGGRTANSGNASRTPRRP